MPLNQFSSSKDRREGGLHVAKIGRYRGRGARFLVVGRLEFRLLFLAFDGHLASYRFLWVLLVVGERSDRLIVASLGRVSRFEGLIMLNKRGGLGLWRAMWDRRVLFKNLFIRVKRVRMLGPLRERLILHHGL